MMPAVMQQRSIGLLSHPGPQGQRQQHLCRQRCLAEAGGGATPPAQPSRDEVLARINRAREYKKVQQPASAPRAPPGSDDVGPAAAAAMAAGPAALGPPAASPPPPVIEPLPPPIIEPTSENVEQAFSDAAQALAAKEEAEFLQAFSQARSSSSSSSAMTQANPDTGSGRSPAAAASKEAVLARINAARQYNKPPAGSSGGASPAPPRTHPPPHPPAPAQAASSQQQQREGQQDEQGQQQGLDAEQQRSFRTGTGGAEQAANWLVFAERSGGSEGGSAAQLDSSLSAEQFTLAKEELKKRQEVEIITVDSRYAAAVRREKRALLGLEEGNVGAEQAAADEAAAGQGAEQQAEGEGLHTPKVATWGVFPRPKSISKAYGGGRNLRPGQALESEEAAAEREQRVAAALKEYRKTLGLDVDPAVERQAQALYDEGSLLFEQGLISSALPKFAEASELMALRSRLGAEARLQQAICLDSLGRNQEAYEIYKKVENHPAPGVAKKAKRMLFGWKAADQLKTNQLRYSPTSSQWKRYFDAINRNSVYAGYVAAEDDGEGGNGAGELAASALAVCVVLLPLAFVAWRILLR